MPRTLETYLLVLSRLVSQWGGLWGLKTSLGICLIDAWIWDKCRETPSPGAPLLNSLLWVSIVVRLRWRVKELQPC